MLPLFIALSALPISELRGAIPLGLVMGYHPVFVFFVSVIVNIAVYFPLRWILDKVGGVVVKLPYVERARNRGHKMVGKYGLIGLAILVGIPLPFTGVYTATLTSWSLKYGYREALLPIAFGVVIAGAIVLAGSLGVIQWAKA